jgi:DNA-binding MarR family transcriptional regulator
VANKINIRPDFEELYPDASARATECAMNLVQTTDMMVKEIARLLQPFDLTPTSGLALSILADSAGPLPPNAIADRLIMSRATVTGLVDSLERRGYARRLPHPSDRRMLLVEITEKGRQAAAQYRAIIHRRQKDWFSALQPGEQQTLIDLLQRMQDRLDDGENQIQ